MNILYMKHEKTGEGMLMVWKKSILGLLVGGLTFFVAGCQEQGDASGLNVNQEPMVQAAATLETEGEPDMTFSFDGGHGSIYTIDGPAADRDFVFLGERIVYAHGAIYRHGEGYRPPKDGKQDTDDWQELYELPVKERKIKGRFGIEASIGSGAESGYNLASCGGYVLFERSKDGMLGLYDGKRSYVGTVPWQKEYSGMVGTAGGELLMVRSPDTICIGKLAGAAISEVRDVVPHALDELQLSQAALRPVRLNEDELFVSVSQGDGTGEKLCCFDREGDLLACYEGDYSNKTDWAVTENYVLQSSGDNLSIYKLTTGKKLFAGTLKDLHVKCMYTLDGDRVLVCGYYKRAMFFVLEL